MVNHFWDAFFVLRSSGRKWKTTGCLLLSRQDSREYRDEKVTEYDTVWQYVRDGHAYGTETQETREIPLYHFYNILLTAHIITMLTPRLLLLVILLSYFSNLSVAIHPYSSQWGILLQQRFSRRRIHGIRISNNVYMCFRCYNVIIRFRFNGVPYIMTFGTRRKTRRAKEITVFVFLSLCPTKISFNRIGRVGDNNLHSTRYDSLTCTMSS